MITTELRGVEKLKRSLRKLAEKTGRRVERAFMKGGLFLQREAQLLTPVDTGALRNSAFTRKDGVGIDCKVIVGYTMSYALAVHENLYAFHPVGQAKYLEQPAREKREDILDIIRGDLGI